MQRQRKFFEGYNKEGYDHNGYNTRGYNRESFIKDGVHYMRNHRDDLTLTKLMKEKAYRENLQRQKKHEEYLKRKAVQDIMMRKLKRNHWVD